MSGTDELDGHTWCHRYGCGWNALGPAHIYVWSYGREEPIVQRVGLEWSGAACRGLEWSGASVQGVGMVLVNKL